MGGGGGVGGVRTYKTEGWGMHFKGKQVNRLLIVIVQNVTQQKSAYTCEAWVTGQRGEEERERGRGGGERERGGGGGRTDKRTDRRKGM